MSRHALCISPHLDDAAFSCAGTLARLAQAGWRVTVCTVFTASVSNPTGFALACQTDKGIAPELDYMALRRAEDRQWSHVVNVEVAHWPLVEAPHRGYDSAAALFAERLPGETMWHTVAAYLDMVIAQEPPALVFAPQGLGQHVDHLQVIRAVMAAHPVPVAWYRDTPYAIRQPDAQPSPLLPPDLQEIGVPIDATLALKIVGSCAYTTQLPFQWGGADQVAPKLRAFHRAEATRLGSLGHAEAFLAAPCVAALLNAH